MTDDLPFAYPSPPNLGAAKRRTCSHPRRPRTDPVSPERAIEVFERDGGCLAPRLGGSAMDCWGRNRIEHVKREPRMGRRGDLLGTLCEGHTEPGMRAGYVWATDARNREAMRRYLLALPEYAMPPDPLQLPETA